MKIAIHVCSFVLQMLLVMSPLFAQSGSIKITQAHIPEDAFGHVSVRVQKIMQHSTLQLVPWELVVAGCMDEFGFDPTGVESVEIIFGAPEPGPLQWCAVVSLTEEWKSLEGKKIDLQRLGDTISNASVSLLEMNPKQVVVGLASFIEKVARPPAREGELARQVKRIAQSGLATLIFLPETVREPLEKDLNKAPPQSQAVIRSLLANMQLLAMRLELDPKPSVPVLVETANAEAAQKFAAAWQELVQQIFVQSNLNTQGLGEINTTVKAASVAYEKRFQTELVRLLTPTITGNRLVVRLDSQFLQVLQSSSFMPAITAAIKAGEQAR